MKSLYPTEKVKSFWNIFLLWKNPFNLKSNSFSTQSSLIFLKLCSSSIICSKLNSIKNKFFTFSFILKLLSIIGAVVLELSIGYDMFNICSYKD